MRKLLILLPALIPLIARGQNDIQLTQQFLSRINYNPAATGASEYFNAYILARQDWVGYSRNTPVTQVLNVHNYFESLRSGMGLVVINDKIGATNTVNAKLDYGYHIHFGDNRSYLSLGLGAGVLYKNLDINKLTPEDAGDPTIAGQLGSKVSPDFDFGVEFNTEEFQVGASVTHLNVDPIMIQNIEQGRHFYFYSRYMFRLEPNWKIAPTLTWRMSGNFSGPQMKYGLNTMAYYRDRFWFGAAVRVSDEFVLETIAGIVGLFVTDFLRLGYSYDFNPGPIGKYSGGSHEIMLSVRLGKGDTRYSRKTPRFFE